MTFLQIQQDVYDRIGHAQSPATEVSRRIQRFINRWHRKVLTTPGMAALRRVQLTQASVADQATYGIALKSLVYVSEAATDRKLEEQTLGWYRFHVPDPAAFTGTPEYYVPLGFTRVHTRPANASELFVKSTSASDTNTAYVEVVRTNGYRRSLSVTMTGLTAASLSAAITDVVDVVDFYVAAAAVGTITLHEDSGNGAELSRIPIGAAYPRFLRYALVPTPSAAITYTLDGITDIVDMVNNTDEPLLPMDYHDLLVDGALYDEYQQLGRQTEAEVVRRDLEGRMRNLRMELLSWPGMTGQRVRDFEDRIVLPLT